VFLIRAGDRLAGFALVKRGSALVGDLEALNLAEFFVLRAYRRRGIGYTAAAAIWERFPERWLVRVLANNHPALVFWERAVAQHTQGRFTREELLQTEYDPPRGWVIFRFYSLGKGS
jgi:predicted acetyltransferase